MPAIVRATQLSGGRPAVTYRTAGDRSVLVEYGQPKVDLCVNFFVHAVARRLAAYPVPGVVETAPGLRSLLVHFNPVTTQQSALIDALEELHEQVPAPSSLVVPSRRITLPIAFDDSTSREAVNRYRISTRPDAPNVTEGNNIDYIVRYNGLADREALYSTILDTEWWNAFTGFYPGLPSLLPLDARSELTAPKYNPARTWTAEGAVAIGGPCVVIHPLESPGSYQLFGRTLPITDLIQRERTHRLDPVLIHHGDRVRFERVEEAELIETRRQVFEGRYEYRIEPGRYAVADHLAATVRVEAEATERRAGRTAAASRVKVP
ncbi:carboxyltransferase domain-containing protein [Pseudonocardia sp. H11422]|uniref:carboxyltransferase domain-containing protein n=1 Tax=Pseudonocardia sp. H11422 TaxID=2835866 RepID=UPI001BDC49F4|nr:carboxyltransferase domain-containing protein [Pseudonocardia sp. H11422]